jgi:bacteriorhodopsin
MSLPIHSAIEASFTVTFVLLATTATITLIEALRTPVPYVRHVMNLETAISIVAGYFYTVFLGIIKDKYEWKDLSALRYLDWSITTPLMLISLCLVTGSATNVPIKLPVICAILGLNYLMLYTGYLGEMGSLSRPVATVAGFVPFFLMFSIIYMVFMSVKNVHSNNVLFGTYLVVWSMYGVVYLLDEERKNIATNILDAVSKCLVGIGLFLFYSKVIQ